MAALQEILTYRRTLLAVLLMVCLLTLLRANTDTALFVNRICSNRPFSGSRFSIDIANVPARLSSIPSTTSKTKNDDPTLDIVVSMYREDAQSCALRLKELKSLQPFKDLTIRTFIYTKDSSANVEQLKDIFNTPHVVTLPNLGREADTYFTHILERYSDLARHTMFIQAEMHEFEGAKTRIKGWFRPNTGVLSLGQIESCSCVSCHDSWDNHRSFPRIEELYSALNGEFCPQKIALTYLGQIIVSAERIRSRGPSTYKYLRQVLDSDKSSFIHTDPRQPFFNDEPSEPYFGHTIERSYMVLWNCSSDDLARRCGGLSSLHTPRPEGLPDDYCQCLDSP
ncbi:uncharacterized protein PV09_08966 [Verruconis gallopava]|uniref:Uncharacterized protein n=1 Tax=Verruconis gallopava TaxID=253628 RepID=A0A0D1XAQ7_9PEZI|nr:uncharacterized protein PV09_08966 [Verruconis gallopava]KIV99305.1 hypothetical protein PV09_08966 [Verruconis gallopava]